MQQLDSFLADFHEDLKRAEELLALVKKFRKFAGSRTPKEVHENTVRWPEAVDLALAAPGVRTDLPIFSGSILLYLCGRFENFVRELVVLLADDMAAKATGFNELPERVRIEIQTKTLEVAQRPGKFGYTKDQSAQLLIALARNLDDSHKGQNLTISSRLLSIAESNMHSEMLAEIFKRVDVTDLWNDLGKQAPLKFFLSERVDKDCTAKARVRLDDIMKERNGIAHPTGTVSFPDPDQVMETSDFFKVLSRVLVDVARVPR